MADNGSDMYIRGTFDTRWDNDLLSPAFAALTASDFEVIELGWRPGPADPDPAALASLGVSPSSVVGGQPATGTVTVGAGVSAASFTITTSAVAASTAVEVRASYGGDTEATTLTVTPVTATPPPA